MILPVLYRSCTLRSIVQNVKLHQRFFSFSSGLFSIPPSNALQSIEDVQTRLIKAQESYRGDAYMRILSAPMRRCQATMLVLPKLMMFKVVPFQGEDRKPFPLPHAWKLEEDALREKEQLPRTDRWFKRQSKVLLLKRLERESRMLQHKIVTSQSPEAKMRFEIELGAKKKLMEHWKYSASRKGKVWEIEGMQKDSDRIRQGAAWWCTLNVDAALTLWSKKNHLKFSYPKEKEFVQKIGQVLERDVLESLLFLQKQVQDGLVGEVIEQIAFEPQVQDNTKYNENEIAAIIYPFSDTVIAANDKIEEEDRSTPLYSLPQLCDDNEGNAEQILKLLKCLARTTEKASVEMRSSFIVKQHPSTTNFCLSLWRLKTWRDSIAQCDQDPKLEEAGT